jgi:hypothetical protein
MEVFAIAAVAVLALCSVIATVIIVAKDGRGHTPPIDSHRDWSALDLPSSNYTMRPF